MGLFKFEKPIKDMPSGEIGRALREQTVKKISAVTSRFTGLGSKLFDTVIGGAVKAPGVVQEGFVSGAKAVDRGSQYVDQKLDQWDQLVDRKTTEGGVWVNQKLEGAQKWAGDRATNIQEGGKAAWVLFREKIGQANDWKNRMIESHRQKVAKNEFQALLAEQEAIGKRYEEIEQRKQQLSGIIDLDGELNPEVVAA